MLNCGYCGVVIQNNESCCDSCYRSQIEELIAERQSKMLNNILEEMKRKIVG